MLTKFIILLLIFYFNMDIEKTKIFPDRLKSTFIRSTVLFRIIIDCMDDCIFPNQGN